ncbi:hypothetical protein D9M73_249180 [compost metagenome]
MARHFNIGRRPEQGGPFAADWIDLDCLDKDLVRIRQEGHPRQGRDIDHGGIDFFKKHHADLHSYFQVCGCDARCGAIMLTYKPGKFVISRRFICDFSALFGAAHALVWADHTRPLHLDAV